MGSLYRTSAEIGYLFYKKMHSFFILEKIKKILQVPSSGIGGTASRRNFTYYTAADGLLTFQIGTKELLGKIETLLHYQRQLL